MPILNKVPISDPSGGAFDVIKESTPATGVTVDGVKLKDSAVYTDTIYEKTAGAGVTIDGVLVKDKTITSEYRNVVPTGASKVLTAAESGSLVVCNADGVAITLPAAAAGIFFDFYVQTPQTSGKTIAVTMTEGDFFVGGVMIIDKDAAYNDATSMHEYPRANGTSNDILTLNATTTGGLAGGKFRVTAVDSTYWLIEGVLIGDGNLTTPFSGS